MLSLFLMRNAVYIRMNHCIRSFLKTILTETFVRYILLYYCEGARCVDFKINDFQKSRYNEFEN